MNEVYAKVTDKIIDSLKQGVIPWRMPWRCGMAANIVSRNPYRGINSFLTGVTDHVSPFWMTYKQAKDLGGRGVLITICAAILNGFRCVQSRGKREIVSPQQTAPRFQKA